MKTAIIVATTSATWFGPPAPLSPKVGKRDQQDQRGDRKPPRCVSGCGVSGRIGAQTDAARGGGRRRCVKGRSI
jgi:hypothetical protein